MRMHISADIPLSEPNVDERLITWFSVEVFDDVESEDEDGDVNAVWIGRARVARIHVGHAFDSSEPLCYVLDADSGELEALYGVFFDDTWLKDEFADGSGADVLYVSDVEIEYPCAHRNIDLAVVRRLCDTIGQGAALAVVPYESPEQIAHWAKLGFEVSTQGSDEGYLHLCLGIRAVRVDDPDEPGHFKILPNPSPDGAQTHH